MARPMPRLAPVMITVLRPVNIWYLYCIFPINSERIRSPLWYQSRIPARGAERWNVKKRAIIRRNC